MAKSSSFDFRYWLNKLFEAFNARGAFSNISWAISRVTPNSSLSLLIKSMTPSWCALSDENFWAVNIQYLDLDTPIKFDSLIIPPAPGMIPSEVSGRPTYAFSDAILKSQHNASSKPPPSAAPFIEAIVGNGKFWILLNTWLNE